jgi:hypothetical protein
MPNTPRIPPAKLQELRDALRALAELPDYAPVNPECTIASLFEAEASMLAETHEEQRQRRGLDLQRDKAIGSEQRFYRLMRAACNHVIAQYGDDSHAVEIFGRRRRSERKKPVRRPPAAD